jgi:hypothetical protein
MSWDTSQDICPTIPCMERITDKGLVIAACVVLMLVRDAAEPYGVILLLVGISVTAGFDLLLARGTRVSSALVLCAGFCACCVPPATSLFPLVAYDLVRTPWPQLLAVPLLLLLLGRTRQLELDFFCSCDSLLSPFGPTLPPYRTYGGDRRLA